MICIRGCYFKSYIADLYPEILKKMRKISCEPIVHLMANFIKGNFIKGESLKLDRILYRSLTSFFTQRKFEM